MDLQAAVPIARPTDDTGVSRQRVPRSDGHRAATPLDRRGADEPQHVLAAVVAIRQRQQPPQRAAHGALGERRHGRPVVRHRSGAEVVVEQPEVRVAAGVEHGHTVERDTVVGCRDDAADDMTDLVVGVGDADHAEVGKRRLRRRTRQQRLTAQERSGSADRGIGVVVAGQRDDGGGGRVCCDRPQKSGPGGSQLLRSEDDDLPELPGERGPGLHQVGREPCEVLLVVEVVGQDRPDGPMDVDHRCGATTLAFEHRQLGIVEVRQFSVRLDQAPLRGGVLGNGCEPAGGALQGATHGGRDHRRRDRSSPRCRHRVGGEQFGEAIHRHERDADETGSVADDRPEVARGQRSPRGQAHHVAGDDDGDGCEGIVGLGLGHEAMERCERGAAVGRGHGADRRRRWGMSGLAHRPWIVRPCRDIVRGRRVSVRGTSVRRSSRRCGAPTDHA